jgi:hypothetical protein
MRLHVGWFLRLQGRGSDTNFKPCFDSNLCTTELQVFEISVDKEFEFSTSEFVLLAWVAQACDVVELLHSLPTCLPRLWFCSSG